MDTEIQEHEVGTTRTPFGFCLKCTHELIAEGDGRCSECGLAFNPRSRRSYYAFQPGWMAKRFLAPPGVLWWLTFLFLSIYLMAASYAPGGFLIAEILGGFALVVAGGFYLLCLISSLLVHLRFGRIWWGARQLWWLVGPCIVLIGLLLIFLQFPIRVGFSYSRSAMEAQVALTAPGPPASRPAWLGLYPVRYDGNRPNLLLVRGAGFINSNGFVHLPNVQGTDYYEEGDLRAWRFDGDWFLAELQF